MRTVLALALLVGAVCAAIQCTVCETVIAEISATVSKGDAAADIERAIDAYCESTPKRVHQKVCYYITPIKREVSRPLSIGVDPKRICKKLAKSDTEICGVKAPVKIVPGQTDYSSMRVSELKMVLAERSVMCDNCLEKSEFVARCVETEHMEL